MMPRTIIIIFLFCCCKFQSAAQSDSLNRNDFHYRFDLGLSLSHIIENGLHLSSEPQFYLGIKKNMTSWNWQPEVNGFFFNQVSKDTSYFNRKIGIRQFYLGFRLERKRNPTKVKSHFYYGVQFCTNIGFNGTLRFGEYSERIITSYVLNCIGGFDFKILKGARFFAEIQTGILYQKSNSIIYINNSEYDRFSSNYFGLSLGFLTPFVFGFSFFI